MSEQAYVVNEDAQRARDCRRRVGLDITGAVPDLLRVVESAAGVAVSVIDLPSGVSGAYTVEEGIGFAFVNLNDVPVRQRFTLAHELAHHVFGDGGIVDEEAAVFGAPSSPRERRAQTFAAEFLIPLRAVSTWMDAHDTISVTLRSVVELAADFRVSAKTALIRLQLDRYIDQGSRDYAAMSGAIDRGEHLKLAQRLGIVEAPDTLSEIYLKGKPRTPAKMWEFAVAGYEQGLLTIDRIAQAVHKPGEEISALLDEMGAVAPEDEPDY